MTTSETIEYLFETGDFLQLTRDNEWHLKPLFFTLHDGTEVQIFDTGVIQFEPPEYEDKDIVISSAVHGNETAPIEICDSLIKKIFRGDIQLAQRVLFIFGNPAAINIHQRFVEENLNRLFDGHHNLGPGLVNKERARAKLLETYVDRFYTTVEPGRYRCHYDLHTAIRGAKYEKFAIYPYLHGRKYQKSQFELLHACGVETFLLMAKEANTFSYHSSANYGADAFTIELGKVRPFGENDMSKFAATEQTLEALMCDMPFVKEAFDEKNFNIFNVHRSIMKDSDAFKLNFADDVENFTDFPVGFTLADDGDTTYDVDTQGEAIIFPNAGVAIGQRALLTVIPADIGDDIE